MQITVTDRPDAGIFTRLGLPAPAFWRSELDRFHLVQRRGGADVHYLVARDGRGATVGLLPVYLASPPWEAVVDPALILGTAAPEPPATGSPSRLCLAGSGGAYGNHLVVGASVADPAAVAVALVERARALAADAGCRQVLLPHLDEVQSSWLDGCLATALATGVREKAVLPVLWDSFDEYLAWLSVNGRRRVRLERRAFLEGAVEVREESLPELAAALAPLAAQTEHRYGHDITVEQVEFYLTMLGMDLDCVTLVAYRDGRPVGFSLTIDRGDRWIMRSWGCDYASPGPEPLYFNMVFHEVISRAIERRVPLIDFGVGSLTAKTQRGCRPEPLRSVLIPAGL
ncbi:GNAT family N-acetyltransferase [Kitasatospora sp. NPDC127059]|uniref:GNAT family N-acetyltransferase n=1 Tax=unclassified Kitasatospora TaxID=2633591 RepID=UPI00365B27D6